MKHRKIDTMDQYQKRLEYLGGVALGLVAAAISLVITGCSFRTEFGWHGQTGRDDRIQTQLVNTQYKKRPLD